MGLTRSIARKREKEPPIESVYEIEKSILGSGNYASVHLARPRDPDRRFFGADGHSRRPPSEVAVKAIDKTKTDGGSFSKMHASKTGGGSSFKDGQKQQREAQRLALHREVQAMWKAVSPPHDSIIQLFEVFETPKRLYLVTELLSGGDLFERVIERSFFPQREAARTLQQICSGLDHLHCVAGVVHRDIKPENILYVSQRHDSPLKLADFGSSIIMGRSGAHNDAGTPGYVAPEILNNEGKGALPCVDMWAVGACCRLRASLSPSPQPPALPSTICRWAFQVCAPALHTRSGVILYILLCGFPPFFEEELPALFDSIAHARYDFPPNSPWDDVSDCARDLIGRILTLDTGARLSASEVMNHKWAVGAIAGTLKSSTPRKLMPAHARSAGLRVLRKAALGVLAQQRIMRAIGGGFRHGAVPHLIEGVEDAERGLGSELVLSSARSRSDLEEPAIGMVEPTDPSRRLVEGGSLTFTSTSASHAEQLARASTDSPAGWRADQLRGQETPQPSFLEQLEAAEARDMQLAHELKHLEAGLARRLDDNARE